MDSLGKFLMNLVSKHHCSRKRLFSMCPDNFVSSIKSGNVIGISRDQIILIIEAICIAKKDKHTALSLLNQEFPKKKRRFKFDSKNKRRRKFMKRNG